MKISNTQKLKILLVEDDPFAKHMLAHILESTGYVVFTAANGVDGLNLFYQDPQIDLIVSDMNMPEMNGQEMIQEIRQRESDIPIIVLTSNREIKTAIETIYSGADDYLLKDENIQETFLHSIRKVWDRHCLEKEKQQLMVDLERKNRELERLSFLDGLTEIANRRYFDMVIRQEWRRSIREKKPLSLLMVDIDYFKFYNDTYGHQAGDRCLKQVAEALDDSLKRPGDFVARYGGEEFVGVLPNSDMAGAMAVARKMHDKVAALALAHEASKSGDYITISIGIATTLAGKQTSLQYLIKSADDALYKAKKNGRNQSQTMHVIDAD
jgi:diguanylate cyclase (GGDEF)-like protein